MLKFLFPHQEDFFQLFQSIGVELVSASNQFELLLNTLNDKTLCLNAIRTHENQADALVNNTLEKLHKTFITPFDRNDIHRFVVRINDVIEAILGTAERINIYQMTKLPSEIYTLGSYVATQAQAIHAAISNLHTLDNPTQVLEYCNQINGLESKAEFVLLAGVSKLFHEENDIKELLKTKEIYEYTKSILNESEMVANIIKDIVLEYS